MTQLVASLQERMLLPHWRVEILFDCEKVDGSDARIRWSFQYDEAVLELCVGWRAWSEGKARRILAHEFGHLLARDLQVAVLDQEDPLGDGWDQFFRRYTHELEGLIERFAAIVTGPA